MHPPSNRWCAEELRQTREVTTSPNCGQGGIPRAWDWHGWVV